MSTAPLPLSTVTPQDWADARADLDALPTPTGVDAATFAQLRDQLALLLGTQAEKSVKAVPNQSKNVIEDIALSGDPAVALTLSWSYKNVGDYSNDGEVNISDLTPLGIHLRKTPASPDWDIARAADGDANGEITVSDLTPIGQNLFAQVSGYRIYSAADSAGPWMLVDSLDMSEATAGFPRRFSFNLPQPFAAYYTIAPFDPTGADAINAVSVVTPAEGATVQPGAFTEVDNATVGTSGGTLTGAVGTPLEGYSVNIPADAFEADVDISLGYNDGTVTPALGTQHGPIIEINTNFDGNIGFAKPVEITVPYTAAAGSIPLPYYITPDGALELAELSDLDSVAGTMSFVTTHASAWAVIQAGINDPFAPSYDSKFDPAVHGMAVPYGTEEGLWTGTGAGAAMFSAWHYMARHAPLFTRFTARVGGDAGGPDGQQVIAFRARDTFWANALKWYEPLLTQAILLNGEEQWTQIKNALTNTHGPVGVFTVGSNNKINRSLIAFAYVGNSLFCYDGSMPGQTQTLTYDEASKTLQPYLGSSRYAVHGVGSLAVREPYSNILQDAEAGFHGSSGATIDLSPRANGDIIQTRTVVLEGIVSSGSALVDHLRVYVGNQEGSFETDVAVGGAFSVTVPLLNGDNWLRFETSGHSAAGNKRSIPNNYENVPFLLKSTYIDPGPGVAQFRLEITWDPSVGPQPGQLDLVICEKDSSGNIVTVLNGASGSQTTGWGSELVTSSDGSPEYYEVRSTDLRPDDWGGIIWAVHRTDDTSGESKYQPYTVKIWYYNAYPGPPYSIDSSQLNFGDGLTEPNWSNIPQPQSPAWGIFTTFGF